jgi:uncharacterized protein
VGRAAPIYFLPARVTSVSGATTLECIDGGVAVNDPVLVAYAEARQLQRTLSDAAAQAPILVVSVGTGILPAQAIPFDAVKEAGIISWLLHGLMEVILDGPNVAANQIAEVVLPEGSFYRFQAPLTGPGYAADPAMDDWSETNLEALKDAAQYLIHREQATLVEVVQRLIG